MQWTQESIYYDTLYMQKHSKRDKGTGVLHRASN